MFGNYFRIFLFSVLFFGVNLLLSGQNSAPKSEDYKKWTLEQLIFTIDSGLLDEQTRLNYIEFYLQKAKKENAIQDIVTGYEKKVANLKDYNSKTLYADSLIEFAHRLNNNKNLGVAYGYKSYVEFVIRNYEKALDYGLKAEEYLKHTDDLYTLNKVKNFIATCYYHLEEYSKSYIFFKETTIYYKKDNNNPPYNNLRGYISNIFGLSKVAYRLQKYDTLQMLINEGYAEIPMLKTHHQPLETAYFSLVEGMYNHDIKNYQKSDSLLRSAIPLIKKNNNPNNEYLAYLFLGKNLWEQNQKEKALSYFLKTDSLYQNKKIITVELSEAYTYIIDYYKEQNNSQKQLYYTNVLLQISDELNTRNKSLTTYLHNHVDIKKEKEAKANLEKEINQNKKWAKYLYIFIVALILLIIGLFIKHLRFQKQQNQYKILVEENSTQNTLSKTSVSATTENKTQNLDIPDTAQIILQKLAKFEENKGFTDKVTLDDLAKQFLTNRTTLSKIINDYKGVNFNTYLNQLRVDYAIKEISTNPDLQELKLDALAEEFGFGNAKSFSAAFKEVTTMSINDFFKLNL